MTSRLRPLSAMAAVLDRELVEPELRGEGIGRGAIRMLDVEPLEPAVLADEAGRRAPAFRERSAGSGRLRG